jgi:hypothetical protein
LSIDRVASRNASTFANNVNSAALAYPGNVTAGDFLVCGGLAYHASGVASVAVNDTRGTSYSVLSFAVGTLERAWIAYGFAPSSGANTVTADPSPASGNYLSFSIDEFSGVHAIPLSVDGGHAVGFGTTVDPTITTATAGELIVGCMGYDGATTTIAPGSGWTPIGEHEDNTTDEAHALEFGIVTTAQAYVVRWTLGANKDWQVMVASFKAAGPTYTLTAAAGTYTLTGNAAGLKAGRSLAQAVGSFVETGIAAGLVAHHGITLALGAYAFTGNAVGLSVTAAAAQPVMFIVT